MASVSDVSKKSWMRFVFVSLIHEKPINGALPKSHMSRITKKLKICIVEIVEMKFLKKL